MKWRSRLFIDGKWIETQVKQIVRYPYTDEPVSEVDQASESELESAIEAAALARTSFRNLSRYSRSALCSAIARIIQERRAEFIDRIVFEAAKPRLLSEIEVNRAISTFHLAAEEAKRFGGEIVAIDTEMAQRDFDMATSFWQPRGIVLAITPFNFPLNLVAHKVAPALAAGAPVILKPAPQAPGAATLLAETFERAAKEVSDSRDSISLSAFQVIHASNETMSKAISDTRISILSFTGSDQVGWMLRDQAKKKRVLLELGGNAAAIVHEDADLARAAKRIAFGAYAYAGQICISVQRIFAHKSVSETFLSLLTAEIAKLKVGDPNLRDTVVGPLIDNASTDRVLKWVQESGAKIILGGERDKNTLQPILLSNISAHQKISCEEIFGPVATFESYESFEEVLKEVNASRYGLQAGLFTDSHRLIQSAIKTLEVGGILINEIPTFRSDSMPYGGFKDSGLGREGVRYAMQEYSDQKTVIHFIS